MTALLQQPTILSQGSYLQLVVKLKLLDDAIIRSNEAEEVLTFTYKPPLNNRFVIPWRKVKGKLRRLVMEKQRSLDIMKECCLKDNLCMKCPSCFMFGGTGETSSAKTSYNILARIMGETFISTTDVGEIQPYTQNAVDEKTLTTGQALMSILTVPAETKFVGVVTVRDATPEMVSIVVDNLDRLARIGARSVEWGRISTEIVGYKLSDREDLSAYYLAAKNGNPDLKDINTLTLPDVADSYRILDEQTKELISSLADNKKGRKKGGKTKEETG
jgi:CRISPR type I-D-associated protein Csc2